MDGWLNRWRPVVTGGHDPDVIERGCGWNRGEVAIDVFGSSYDGWLVRRGSRGGFGGVAARDGMDGTNLLGFRVRRD